MGARKILILFFSTMTVSLVILIVLFNLLFKNMNMDFETKTPESAPTIQIREPEKSKNDDINSPADFKQKGNSQSRVHVPGQRIRPSQDSPETLLTPEPPTQKSLPLDTQDSLTPPKIVDSSGHTNKAPIIKLKKLPEENPSLSENQTFYQVYIDGFHSEDEARLKVAALKSQGIDAFVNTSGGRPIIKLGTFSNQESAQALASQHGAKVKPVN